jgi:hypothetical protein
MHGKYTKSNFVDDYLQMKLGLDLIHVYFIYQYI